jgi:PDZ domain-containing secreted protein
MTYARRIAKWIDSKGERVDIEDYSSPTYSEYGDLVTQSTSNLTNIKAIFNQYGLSSQYQTEGVFQNGDCSFFFKANQTGLDNGNVIIRANGERWKISQSYHNYIQGQEVHTECRVTNA